jgi:urea carboxylase
VYLGAPLATPVDPRHRLVTTKYNPARTWTADGTVGIGGAYMCIYGMESPGGYQLVGRTVQVWNTYNETAAFTDGKPWLLRFFDQVKFHLVTTEELATIREGVIDGTATLDITETTFSLKDYRAFLAANVEEIRAAKARQQAAFDAERARWQAADQKASSIEADVEIENLDVIPPGSSAVESTVPGCVWKVLVDEGARVAAGDVVVIVESMKMEMAITAPSDGIVTSIYCAEGKPVSLGQKLMVVAERTAEAAQ